MPSCQNPNCKDGSDVIVIDGFEFCRSCLEEIMPKIIAFVRVSAGLPREFAPEELRAKIEAMELQASRGLLTAYDNIKLDCLRSMEACHVA